MSLQRTASDDVVARLRRSDRRRLGGACAGLAVAVLVLALLRVVWGTYQVTVPDLVRILGGETIPGASFIVLEEKLPRAVAAVLTGAALGAAGALYRRTLRNPLASPDILGVTQGAAAAVVLGSGAGDGPLVGRGVQHMWPETLDIMGWDVDDVGLGVIFDRSIPDFAEAQLRAALDSLAPDRDVDRYVCHPGGAKVITALEATLDLAAGTLDVERRVLAQNGNMSAPTVLFVLAAVLRNNPPPKLMAMALGPGFTLSVLPIMVA